MTYPNETDIEFAINLCKSAILRLVENDSDIFDSDEEFEGYFSTTEDVHILNRKLHEVTITHRLAVYLEEYLRDTPLQNHSVDLEYNRFYNQPKDVETFEGHRTVRPDIIIHTRTNKKGDPQHYLVVEAKKEEISDHDRNKILGFLSDERYNYQFGLTVSYCIAPDHVQAYLFYGDGAKHYQMEISVPKREGKI
jgi:hypothetical protein